MNVWMNNEWARLSHTFCPLKVITGSSHSDEHFVSIGALVLPDTLVTSGVTRDCSHKVGCPASPAPTPSPKVYSYPSGSQVSVAQWKKGS